MRGTLVLLLIGCGAPAFVPVTFTLNDQAGPHQIFAKVTKKLNPNCASSCELAQGIEDGGCSEIRVTASGTECVGSGSLYLVFDRCDAGSCLSAPRGLAPGATLEATVQAFDVEPTCTSTFTVPATAFAVTATRDNVGLCTFTSSP